MTLESINGGFELNAKMSDGMTENSAVRFELTEKDLSIMLDVLRLNPSMELTVSAVRFIERVLSYPISSIRDFEKLFAGSAELHLADRTVSAEQVAKFLTEESFPILDREELISRIVMACERERISQILAIPVERSEAHSIDERAER
jgi:hypothetical protein